MFDTKYYISSDAVAQSCKNEEKVEKFIYDKGFDTFDNAVILPIRRYKDPHSKGEIINEGGVCDENYNFISGYFSSEGVCASGGIELTRSYKPDYIELSEETVIFSGILVGAFGHFITDSITRLWYAVKNTNDKYKVALLVNPIWGKWFLEPNNPVAIKFLNLIGIESERILIIEKPTKFRSVIVPKQSAYWLGGKYDPELLKIVYDKARQNVTPKNHKKIYLSRSLWRRSLLNESYFEDFFVSRGFKVIHTQDLPIEEQIAYIAGADEIACSNGTLHHLTLFAKPGINLICLFRHSTSVSTRQHIIDQLKQLNSVYIDTSFDFLPSSHSFDFNLIAPTAYFSNFLKSEYGLNTTVDIFEYLNSSQIKFGDYFKLYLQSMWKQYSFSVAYGFKFNAISYLKSLYNALDPVSVGKMLKAVKITDNPIFRNKLFIYKRSDTGFKHTIKLLADGRIWPVDADTLKDEIYWSFIRGRLYFLNCNYQTVSEFVIEDTNSSYGRTKYNGVIQTKVTDTCSLCTTQPGELRNWIIKHTIKYLVNKRRYKKLKKTPERFFRDSKNAFIRYLGRYYIRGNSTVIYYWRKQFKEYLDKENISKKVYDLKDGMDEVSCRYVDNFMRLSKFWYSSTCVGSQWTNHDIKKQRQCKIFAKNFNQPFPDILTIKPYFFFDIYGLADLPRDVLSNINGKVIIDGGGLNGDTALVFHEHFRNSEIHVYEPLKHYIDIINKFLHEDACNNKIIPINKGLADEVTKTYMRFMGSGNMADITTIDTEYIDKDNKIGLIKLDTEGMETNIIKGAEQIISRDKPVLAIAIYHRPEDFFDLKGKIKTLNPDYRFMIRKSEPSLPQADLVLIAY